MKSLGPYNLTIDEKAVLIRNNGSIISQCDYRGLNITLYRVDNEFLEIWYLIKMKKVLKIESLKDKAINPYLKYLNLSHLN